MSFGLISAYAITIMLIGVWLFSVIRKDAGIIDVFWGLGYGLIAVLAIANVQSLSPYVFALYVLVILWAVRLGGHLLIRWRKEEEEDKRYQSMRRNAGPGFWWKSLYIVFGLQGLLMYLVAQPLIQLFPFAATTPAAPTAFVVFLIIAVIGLLIETISDIQLTAFRAAKTGGILKSGLWARSRHPNYFGDALFWWGISLAAISAAPEVSWTLFAPIIMNVLLVRVSGAALLEKYMSKREGYAEYQAKTNRFIPKIFN
ncbi:DUF1295 domain-containing protein [Alphaproteobacteria bacterium]|nr:DUF1295 domain-containing protein [Alphaproteobacteria bacterium]